MQKQPDDRQPNRTTDADIQAFIDAAPRTLTYSELEAECRRRFGETRAWTRYTIMRYWEFRRLELPSEQCKLSTDREVADFIDDRLGRWAIDSIRHACREQFGNARTPSRSSLYRYWQRSRQAML